MRLITVGILIAAAVATGPVLAQSNEDVRPLRPPAPLYPAMAASKGLTGDCLMRFDIDTSGKPYNITAECTDDIFERESIRAVSKMEYAPKIEGGQAVERKGVTYPLVYRLN